MEQNCRFDDQFRIEKFEIQVVIDRCKCSTYLYDHAEQTASDYFIHALDRHHCYYLVVDRNCCYYVLIEFAVGFRTRKSNEKFFLRESLAKMQRTDREQTNQNT
jgi:hypothetical protein